MKSEILVFGDVIIDKFVYGDVIGVSAETPTVVAKFKSKEEMFGGANLVADHIEEFNKIADVLTVSNSTSDFYVMSVVEVPKWKLSTKSRYFVDGYKMVQFDDKNEMRHSHESSKKVIERLKTVFSKDYGFAEYKTVIISDNRHGCVSEEIARFIIENEDKNYDVVIDAQYSQTAPNYDWYHGCDLLSINEKEFRFLCEKMSLEPLESYSNEEWIKNISMSYDVKNIILKLGSRGTISFIDGKFYCNKSLFMPNVVDTCGAGDALLAYVVSHDWKNNTNEVMTFANTYAAICCELKGTTVPTREQAEERFKCIMNSM